MSELDEKKKRKKAGSESSKESSLRDWFKRKGAKGKKGGWVDCNAPDGKGGYKSCGRSSGEKRKKYPACRPTPGACKERGRGKSWGKKGSKKKRNENMQLTAEQIKKIIQEELELVLTESDDMTSQKLTPEEQKQIAALEKLLDQADESADDMALFGRNDATEQADFILDSINNPAIYKWYIGRLRKKLDAMAMARESEHGYLGPLEPPDWDTNVKDDYIDTLDKDFTSRTKGE